MSDSDAYLRELRRALPFGCRRRFVAEMREHFASAVSAEAERGIGTAEAERLTIERLGPADGLAKQVRADLRSGALGRFGGFKAALTAPRVLAGATVAAIAIVAGAIFAGTHSSPAPSKPSRMAQITVVHPTVTLDPRTGQVRMVVYAVQNALRKHQSSITLRIAPMPYYVRTARPKR
jgi:hypothetical protein